MWKSIRYIQIIILILSVSCKKEAEDIISKPYILAGDFADPGIVHIDLNPDSVFIVQVPPYGVKKDVKFDIDKDGKNDYEFILTFGYSVGNNMSSSDIQPLENNMLFAKDSLGMNFIVPLKVGDTINRHLNWVNEISIISYFFNSSGGSHHWTLWKENEIDFVGIMMPKDNDTLYGWIRIKFENAELGHPFKDKITVFDWAYTSN